MVLMYWREYRTQEHVGETYGVAGTTVGRTVRRFEDVLIKGKRLHLPGRNALLASDTVFEVVLVDATESACERPKKTAALLQRQEEAPHPQVAGDRR